MVKLYFFSLAVNVHIDVYSAETGITRFTELNRDLGWLYNKSENLSIDNLKSQFTHLLVEAESMDDKNLKPFEQSHQILDFVRSFKGIYFTHDKIPLPKIRWLPKIFILKKRN